MQFKAITLSLFAAAVTAQNSSNSTDTSLSSLVSQLPTCALDCFNQGAKSVGCSTTDFGCLCSSDKQQSFVTSAGTCLFTSQDCSNDEVNKIKSLASQICTADKTASPSQVASASAVVASEASATSASATGQAVAMRPELGYGIMGAVGAMAAFAL